MVRKYSCINHADCEFIDVELEYTETKEPSVRTSIDGKPHLLFRSEDRQRVLAQLKEHGASRKRYDFSDA